MITKFKEYQEATKKTAIYPKEKGIEYCIMGLLGEAGEIANKYKKVIRDSDGILDEKKTTELYEEIGDVLWYISELSTNLGFLLENVADYNIYKLQRRKRNNTIKGSGDHR